VFGELFDGVDDLLPDWFLKGVGLRGGFWFGIVADELVLFLIDLLEMRLSTPLFLLVELGGVDEAQLL
jgi:hypothetical protein